MPVFIVGFARSGTTLCQRLVAERFKLRTLPETHFFERLGKYHPEESRLTSANARALLEELRPYLDMNPATHEPLLAQPEVSVRALFLSLVEEQTGHPRDTAAGPACDGCRGRARPRAPRTCPRPARAPRRRAW